MSSTDRRLVRRPQTTIIESSVEPHEEEEEERERPRRLRAEMLRRPPRFRIELNERSIVSLGESPKQVDQVNETCYTAHHGARESEGKISADASAAQ